MATRYGGHTIVFTCKRFIQELTPCLPPTRSLLNQVYGKHAIAHERLAIIDPDSGSQPLVSPDGKGKQEGPSGNADRS